MGLRNSMNKMPDYIISYITREWWNKLDKDTRDSLSSRKRMPPKKDKGTHRKAKAGKGSHRRT